jgi:hypothetical protein
MKIYQVLQKLLVGDREIGDLISLLSFLESRLKHAVRKAIGWGVKRSQGLCH